MTVRTHPLRLLRAGFLMVAFAFAAAPASAQEPHAIPGVEGWQLFDRTTDAGRHGCIARISGPEASTTLVINNVGVPLVIASRPDWNHSGSEEDLMLSVDGGAPVSLRGGFILKLVLTKIEDPALLQRLRGARTLDWTFPFGRFRANVAGLGIALDAVRACEAAAPA